MTSPAGEAILNLVDVRAWPDGTGRELTEAEDAVVVAVIEQAADGRRIALRPPA
jgi:hypothetical protein